MKHFIIAFYTISFISGISAITMSIVAYIRYKNELIKYYIFFISTMAMLLLEQTISTYSIVNNVHINNLKITIMVLSYISCSSLIYILPLITYRLMNIDVWYRRKKLYTRLGVVPLLALIGKYTLNMNIFVWIANTLLFTVITVCITIIIRNFKLITNYKIKNYLKLLTIFSLVFFPYMYLDTKTEYISFLSKYFPYGLLSVPAFYLTWNVVSIYWAIRYIREKEFTLVQKQNKEDILKEFYDKYKVTNREQEVITLLIKGYSYQEICDQLCISLSTVKTHVRNIYQKTDVRNKIELINIINGANMVV